MNPEIIRVSTVTKIAELLKLFNNCFPRSIESRVGDLDSYSVKLSQNAFVYGIQVNNEIAGIVVFYANNLTSRVAYLSQIAVSKEYRNKGIGSFLLRFTFNLCKDYGMEAIKLEVDKENFRAISCYEKNGFTILNQASSNSQYMIKELM